MDNKEVVAIMDVANSTILTDKMTQEDHERVMNDYHHAVEKIASYGGKVWKEEGDCVIIVFDEPDRATMGMIALLQELNEFNADPIFSTTPFLVRIGIAINKENSMFDIPEDNRAKASRKALNEAGHLEKACPVGRIAISEEVYKRIDTFKDLFRPTPGTSHFILEKRPLVPQEQALVGQLLSKQRKALPALCFLGWDIVKPEEGVSLNKLRSLLNDNVAVILGDSSNKRGILEPAATSDTIGLMEALSLLRVENLKMGIDEWQDTADLVVDNHVIIVGSGATNMYALVVNDVFKHMRFYRAKERDRDRSGRSLDTILVTNRDGKETFFGRHARGNEDAGLLVMARSAFNLNKVMVLIAGITGMGTQAAFNLFKDIALGRANINECAIGCVVSPNVKSSLRDVVDIQDYYRKWRISDYSVLHQIDREGNSL
ncbi:MAG: adenylate/guanylate cyclase domain-containing protein [Nitrospirae bacterium]|nr:adenylate/guanylate cyclase domain-containing protein [Nitrospirota bacterium]